ncbi:MAG: precorrin-6y C5,15-methyltransferase (decarboxylating) subunit CbiE [Devosiaceae bacterium]|nr:precorrin-6y C5,15-methyltransferase (decarboxylating) subunit CbiE [Devosiaceae bacterium]
MSEAKSKKPPWLHVIGLGENGLVGIDPSIKELIYNASFVLGPKRLLDRLPTQIDANATQQRVVWQPPFTAMIEQIKQRQGLPTIILASGDPNWFGIGSSLAGQFETGEYVLHPALSSFQLAGAKMRWPLQDVEKISLHGRPAANLIAKLYPGAKILALTSNKNTLKEIGRLLVEQGYENSELTVLENLGGSEEKLECFIASNVADDKISDFYVLAINCIFSPEKTFLPLVPGLPINAYEHDGQITKSQVRAATIASLAPTKGALLWDIGAGSGSVAIEWMRAAEFAKAIAFEKNLTRCKNIELNKEKLGVPGLKIIPGPAIEMLAEQPAPNAIFLGGDVANDLLFEVCWRALLPGGRMVANAVTIESQTALFERQKIHGGDIISIQISSLEYIGSRALMRPSLPVVQWIVSKPIPPQREG